MKKAIFGGSFDPPHIGHLEIIQQTLIIFNIDELIVVPAFLNPFKSTCYASGELRLKWLKTMTEKMPKVTVSSYEIDHGHPVASIETVRHFKKDPDETIYLIIGADNLQKLSQWKDYEELDAMVTWVVATRQEIEIPSGYLTLKIDHDISATQLRENMQEAYLDKRVAQDIITYYKEQ